MSKWLQSGMRRDLCVLLYGERRRGQQLKADVEAHYDGRLDPDRFYGAMQKLVRAGYVEKGREGLHDVYALTDAGERAVEDHAAWIRDEVA
ncbi:PadR family transcriptional regulator [Halostella sp. JP-L12]|uniref:PadR family transcriptional regulator n=1 Tax=Halostella TaxID=1843185 RepID=UPI000EF83CF9|nr:MULTISPECIES: PadR family transcriptional regulator [Halostella]NHN49931.1 PadR family transcriptional regulator [Halostella sp. JP-L12]